MTVRLDTRKDLSIEAAVRVGWQGEGVNLAPEALDRIARARAGFERLIEEPGIVIYGVTSGYGQHAYQRFTPEERKRHARRPSWPAQAHFGRPYPERAVRLMVLARLSNFLEGHAAVRPELALEVAGMLEGPMPEVPMDGAMGAGEILPLSYLFDGISSRFPLAEKESLALINGSPVAAALVTDAVIAAERRMAIAEAILALAGEAYKVPLGHFSPETSALSGDPDELVTAKILAGYIAGGASERRPYQAPVSFRILPKMLGRLRRATRQAREAAEISLGQVSDNPTYFPPDDDHPDGRILSTGGYHNALAWPAINALSAAYADLTTIAERLVSRMLDGNTSGLPNQLLAGEADERYLGTLGFAMVGYAEQAKHAAATVLLPGSEGGGFVQNDVAVPTSLAFEGMETAGRMLDHALGSVAVVASQAFHVTGRAAPPALKETLDFIREAAPPLEGRTRPGPHSGAAIGAIRTRIYGAS